MLDLSTFSIVGRCPRTGMLGVAVATAVPAVGSLCAHVRTGIAAVATQAWTNPYLAIDAIAKITRGRSARGALEAEISADPERDHRQLGMVDLDGNAAAWTGEDCTPYAGHLVDVGMTAQGNMLTGPEVLEAMVEAYKATAALDLAERLLLSLEAGQRAGGDKRGRQSAALKVHNREEYPWLDLRVDEHASPVEELRRIYTVARAQLLPMVESLPKRGEQASGRNPAVAKMLSMPPQHRPGGGGGH